VPLISASPLCHLSGLCVSVVNLLDKYAWMIWQKINYIHANPVKADLVNSAKDYRWTSFHAFYSGRRGGLKS
jgi:hypothetical protein